MIQLSTDELFHFTRFDRLISIIKNGFYPRYNFEHTYLSDMFERPAVVAAIPMVCFCDIPLNMVQEHSSKYGKSAIGLTKEWGNQYGLSPVVYVHKNSRIGDAISAISNSFAHYKASMISDDSDMRIFPMISKSLRGLQQLSYFVKQYERPEEEQCLIGDRLHTLMKGRFYDEREWRFVPPNLHNDMWLIDISTLGNESELEKAHEKLKKYALQFTLTDIKVIVSETDEEKEKLITALVERFNVSQQTVTEKIVFKKLADT